MDVVFHQRAGCPAFMAMDVVFRHARDGCGIPSSKGWMWYSVKQDMDVVFHHDMDVVFHQDKDVVFRQEMDVVFHQTGWVSGKGD